METRTYTLTSDDGKLIDTLLLELATEIDLHYDDEDLCALAPTFSIIKQGIALLERAKFQAHPDVHKIFVRYSRQHQ